jgi:hypothetical protein
MLKSVDIIFLKYYAGLRIVVQHRGEKMDYSESRIQIDVYNREVYELMNRRKFKEARDLAKELAVEAYQLVHTIDNIIEVHE